MTRKFDRRQALTAFGTVGLGALFAACGDDRGGGAATAVPTTDGGAATVAPKTTTSSEIADRFGDSSSCTLTPELTEGPYYVSTSVYETSPYAQHSGRDVLNDGDGSFDQKLLLDQSMDGDAHVGVISFDVASA